MTGYAGMDLVTSSFDKVMRPSQPYGHSGEGNNAFMMHTQSIGRSIANQYGTQSADPTGYYSNYSSGQNWTQRVMEQMKDMALVLSADGRIRYASQSSRAITGHAAEQLTGNFLSEFIHEDDQTTVLREMDESIAASRPLRFHFRFNKTNNAFSILEAYGHPHIASGSVPLESGKSGNHCDGLFLMCRPYPTKSSQLLDSFLEHKVENIRLSQRIAELKREEEEELKASRQGYPKPEVVDSHAGSSEGRSSFTSLPSTVARSNVQRNGSSQQKVGSSDIPLVQADLDDADPDSTTSSDTMGDRVPQPEALSHIDGIEVMTGLYYGDGERSRGLSTGDRRGRLIRCDIDITTTADQRMRSAQDADKRKRLKGEYVCSDCGTYDSPEWRKGPNGPKTLCNACGLRWVKMERKRQGSN